MAEVGIWIRVKIQNDGNISSPKECETSDRNGKLGKRSGIERKVIGVKGTLEALYFG